MSGKGEHSNHNSILSAKGEHSHNASTSGKGDHNSIHFTVSNQSHTKESKPILFGDHFGSRAYYFQGVSYAGRLKYLHSDRKENPLLPPLDLRTKSQMRTVLKLRSQGVQQMQKLDFAKKNETVEEIANKAAKNHAVQAKRNRKKSILVVEKYTSTDKKDWTEESMAGCKFWVNRNSGEVSTECPWEDVGDEHVGEAPSLEYSPSDEKDEGEGEDTPWYDSTEVENFLGMLDSTNGKPKSLTKSPSQRGPMSAGVKDTTSPAKRTSTSEGRRGSSAQGSKDSKATK